MRDLYKRLAVSPEANEQDIKRAVASCQHSVLRQDAESVFAVADRRDVYDTLHGTVSDIGRLRARLGLTHGPHWQGDVANDFSLPPDHTISRHEELIGRVTLALSLYNRWRRFRGSWLLVTIFATGASVGLAAGLALCLWLMAM